MRNATFEIVNDAQDVTGASQIVPVGKYWKNWLRSIDNVQGILDTHVRTLPIEIA